MSIRRPRRGACPVLRAFLFTWPNRWQPAGALLPGCPPLGRVPALAKPGFPRALGARRRSNRAGASRHGRGTGPVKRRACPGGHVRAGCDRRVCPAARRRCERAAPREDMPSRRARHRTLVEDVHPPARRGACPRSRLPRRPVVKPRRTNDNAYWPAAGAGQGGGSAPIRPDVPAGGHGNPVPACPASLINRPYPMMSSRSPPWTCSIAPTASRDTVPPTGVVMEASIFMASMVATVSPALTVSRP